MLTCFLDKLKMLTCFLSYQWSIRAIFFLELYVSQKREMNYVKMWLVSVLLVSAISHQVQSRSSSDNFIVDAVSGIVEDYFVKRSMQFDFIIDSSTSIKLKLTVGKIMQHQKQQISYQVIKVDREKRFLQERSAIWIFDTFERFWEIHSSIVDSRLGYVQTRNFVFCTHAVKKEIEENFRHHEESRQKKSQSRLNTMSAHLWDFLFLQDDVVYLKSFTIFTPRQCGLLELVEVNRFSHKSHHWEFQHFFKMETFNFHGCRLIFGKDKNLYPTTHQAVTDLQSSLNYKLRWNLLMSKNAYQTSERIDLEPLEDFIYIDNFRSHLMTFQHSTSIYGLTVPYGVPYSPLEKLIWPFDRYVWMLLGSTLFVALSTIFLINRFFDAATRNFVYGRNVTTPNLNIFLIVFGGGMILLPGRNFSRFILMQFIMFCLVIRWEKKFRRLS